VGDKEAVVVAVVTVVMITMSPRLSSVTLPHWRLKQVAFVSANRCGVAAHSRALVPDTPPISSPSKLSAKTPAAVAIVAT
jgi:hypothetical protein